eukprot:TCONS_00012640-protein
MSILKGGEDDGYNAAFLGADLELDSTRRREVSLYRHNELVLTVEHGVTLGFLKLMYSSDPKFPGMLQGVKSRSTSNQSPVTSVLLNDERVLDQDEYELIVLDHSGNEAMLQQNLAPLPPPSPASIAALPSAEQCSVSISSTTQQQQPQQQPRRQTTSVQSTKSANKKQGEFVCEYCHLPFVSKAKFLRHRRIHTEENPYECVHCHQSFSHHADLRNHRNEHHMTNKAFKCDFCPKSFSSRAELKGHLWRHTGEKNEKCQICGKAFATKGNLKLHVDKHIGVLKHKCPFCPQYFTSHSSLEAHMAKHTGMKAYKCRYCSKSYAQAGQLTSHERIHTGEKPFVCQVCGKGFRLNSTRLAHEKRHSGVRPHICDTCGRSFSMPDHLRRHLKTHQDKLDRLVPCPFCKKKIFSGRNMRKHLVRHRELNLTEEQAKAIASSLKPDRDLNEREAVDDDQRSHVSNRSVRQMIRCIECNEEIKSVRKLFEHMASVHFQRDLTVVERKEIRLKHGLQKLHHCPFCSAFFIDYRVLRSHVLAEHPQRAEAIGFSNRNSEAVNANATYKCPNCSMFFHLKGALDQHIIKEHLTTVIEDDSKSETAPQFRCWYCRLTFPSPEEVVSHMTSQHETLDVISKRVEKMTGENDVTSSGLWTCSHCPMSLKSHEEYVEHVAMHSIETGTEPGNSTLKTTKVNSSTDEASKYLNPMRIEVNPENSDHHNQVDKYLTTSSIASPSVAMQLLNAKDVMTSSTKTHTVTSIIVTDPSIVTSNEEMYLTTSSLSATVADVDLASSDLTQVDFLRLTNSSTDLIKIGDAAEKSERFQNLIKKNITLINTDAERNSHGTDLLENAKKSVARNVKKAAKNKNNPAAILVSPLGEHPIEACKQCSAIFKTKLDLQLHVKRSHADDIPSVTGTSASIATPTPSSPFRCWFCKTTFESPEEVVVHMTNEHDNIDNLSRRVEMSEQIPHTATLSASSSKLNEEIKNTLKLKHLKRSADASLSAVDGQSCPKCPKKLGSKEAFELHLMVHEAIDQIEHPPNVALLNRQKSLDRTSTGAHAQLYEVSLSAEPISMEESASPSFPIKESTSTHKSIATSTKQLSIIDPSTSKVDTKTVTTVANASKNPAATRNKKSKTKAKVVSASSISKKSITTASSTRNKTNVAVDIDNVNMCTHCSRVFCGRKALYVHTLKMHGKEYLQKRTPPVKQSAFTCWFCSTNFSSPELVVEHMTEAHENLDNLSKRVERQNLSISDSSSVKGPDAPVNLPRFIPIAPQKQVVPVSALRTSPSSGAPITCTPRVDGNQQPPPGFKVSYALAYVPVFVPEKHDDAASDNDDRPKKN